MKAAILCAALLTGCASMSYENTEKNACVSYGLAEGTPEYGQCRLQLAQLRMQRANALLGAGAAVSALSQPQPVPAQPPAFHSYNVNGTAYHCSTLGTFTNCQ